ncbi:MAG: cytidylate kinase [Epulopiscium sp. Nele67-Bin005]|nr:MAG: cytidylate kinase [Epulopiscium sp. Nele67-Bin005]
MYNAIAIDGPAGAGKSTIAKQLAKDLGWVYIDTGAMYRTVAFYCLENDIDLTIKSDVEKALHRISIEISYQNQEQRIFLNKVDVTATIRTVEVAKGASTVAAYSYVRHQLVNMQRELSKTQNVIMDGRDIGTVVLPQAKLKIFLTASAMERAKRRFEEQQSKGINQSLEEVLVEIQDRDKKDCERENSPLKKSDDAIEIDTTNKEIADIIENIKNLLTSKVAL